ncbi:MAG: hypothetical protein II309_09220 [Bacilli bacterium]|nr:hypothetical protein [Bacilli bacterium]
MIIQEYRKQYSSVLHCAYNLRFNNISEKDTEHQLKTLNNIDLIGSYLKKCAVKHATQLLEKKSAKPMIFGGKKNFLQRCQGKISKEEFQQKRLSKLYIIGEGNQHANRFIQINSDLCSFTFKPNRNTNIQLEINGRYKRYKSILQQLYILQQDKQIPLTYQLDDKYIYITYDESVIYKPCYNPIVNRVFAIDLNPNYIGWSVVDWKSSSEFKVITTGVISTKDINDFDNSLKGLPSTDTKKLYINNKRKYEVFEINKYLVQIATHYRCELFITEDLTIESSDKSLGKRYNKLVNNQWNRSKMISNIKKRCNIQGIRFLLVKANYSSFIGNFLYRDLELPDMVLASIELGRRGYEFSLQYIKKIKEKVKNIIFPLISDFSDRYAKSLEEFGISGEINNLKDVYYKLKNAKSRYRVSLDDLNHLKFSRCFSYKSKVKKILITIHKNT